MPTHWVPTRLRASSMSAMHDPELQLLLDPENPNVYLVYADYLQEQADPRGALIVLQHRLETAKGTEQEVLRKAEAKLLALHPDHFTGPLIFINSDGFHDSLLHAEWTWRLGFMRSLHISGLPGEHFYGAQLLTEILEHKSLLLLQDLTLEASDFHDFADELRALHKTRPPLRHLFIGHRGRPEDRAPTALERTSWRAPIRSNLMDVSWTKMSSTDRLLRALPDLETLTLQAGAFEHLGSLHSTSLKSFTLQSSGLSLDTISFVCKAQWPQLDSLELWLGCPNYGAQATVESLRPLIEGQSLVHLRHLALRNTVLSDDICATIIETFEKGDWGLQCLQSLDLSLGTLQDKSVSAMLRSPGAFAHLVDIRLGGNFLSDAAAAELSQALPQCSGLDWQRSLNDDMPIDPQERFRYVVVHE